MTARITFVEKHDVKVRQDQPFTRDFELPQLGPGGNVILMFKVSGTAGQRLTIMINDMSAALTLLSS